MVVSWRIAHLMRTGRTCPDLHAVLMFDDGEIKAAYVLNKKTPPTTQPSLNEVLRHVAMLGGFLARKGDGEPGVKTLWLACSASWTSQLASASCAIQMRRGLVCNGMG